MTFQERAHAFMLKITDDRYRGDSWVSEADLVHLMSDVASEEREACAKIAETLTWRCEPNNADYGIPFQDLIAAAIRAHT